MIKFVDNFYDLDITKEISIESVCFFEMLDEQERKEIDKYLTDDTLARLFKVLDPVSTKFPLELCKKVVVNTLLLVAMQDDNVYIIDALEYPLDSCQDVSGFSIESAYDILRASNDVYFELNLISTDILPKQSTVCKSFVKSTTNPQINKFSMF